MNTAILFSAIVAFGVVTWIFIEEKKLDKKRKKQNDSFPKVRISKEVDRLLSFDDSEKFYHN
jgi:hypothetical protein